MRGDRPTWPADVPVCMHGSWGEVTIVGLDISYVEIAGRQQALIPVRAERLFAKGWMIAPYACHAWPEDLTPLTVHAQELFDEAVARVE